MTKKRILIESWLNIPHSFAIVNSYQMIQWIQNEAFELYYHPVDYFSPDWATLGDASPLILTPEERLLQNSVPLWNGETVDATYRLSYPFDISRPPTGAKKAFVFCTAEYQTIQDRSLKGGTVSDLIKGVKEGWLRIITPSEWCRKTFLDRGIDAYRVPHGVDETKLFPAVVDRAQVLSRVLTEINEDSFVLLAIGAMTANKGIETLLRTHFRLWRENPKVMLILKGLGSLYRSADLLAAAFNNLIQKGDLAVPYLADFQRSILSTDQTMDFRQMNQLYNMADCYVSPYLAEGFNMPVLEAMACGLPAVVTDGGPTDDFVPAELHTRIKSKRAPFGDGFGLFPDEADLLTILRRALTHPRWFRKTSASVVVHARRHFTWNRVARQLAQIIIEELS